MPLRLCVGLLVNAVRWLLILGWIGGPLSLAQAQAVNDTAVKAVFLLRFGSFVDWPPSAFERPDSSLVICIAGDTALAETVRRAARGERAGARTITTRWIESAPPRTGCHILFAGGAEGQDVAESLHDVSGSAVLTVTDARNGNARGIIHFVISDRRVRFHINRSEAEQNGLRIDSRLLGIALSVEDSSMRGSR
ncbi:MAG TPA: YfiR family protein [Hyphomonadaceae bacterium]|nr:YfiR family protein [Hyphomonadaceae bacterium]